MLIPVGTTLHPRAEPRKGNKARHVEPLWARCTNVVWVVGLKGRFCSPHLTFFSECCCCSDF